MKLQYVGPHDGVTITLPDGREASVDRDCTIDVPTDLAESLLEQATNWQRASAAKAPKKGENTDPDPADAAGEKEV